MSGFFGRYLITEDNDGLTVDGNPGTLTNGYYYTWHPTSAYSLIAHIASVMSSLSGKTITASINSTTGKVTLSGSAAFTVSNWQTYHVLGFTSGSLSGSDEYVGTNAALYVWLPGRDPSDAVAPTSLVAGEPVVRASQQRTPNGAVYTSKWAELDDQELEFQYLTRAKTWPVNADNSSLYEFWQDTLSQGRQFIYVPGYPDDTSVVHTYRAAEVKDGQGLGARRQLGPVETYWKWRVKLFGV